MVLLHVGNTSGRVKADEEAKVAVPPVVPEQPEATVSDEQPQPEKARARPEPTSEEPKVTAPPTVPEQPAVRMKPHMNAKELDDQLLP